MQYSITIYKNSNDLKIVAKTCREKMAFLARILKVYQVLYFNSLKA